MKTTSPLRIQLVGNFYEAKKGQPSGTFEYVGRKIVITLGAWKFLDGKRNCDNEGHFPVLSEICLRMQDFAKKLRLSPLQYIEVNGDIIVYMDSPEHGLGLMLPEEAKRMFSGLSIQYCEVYCNGPKA